MKSAGSVSQRGLNPLVLFLRVDEIRWFCFSERVESIGSVSQGKLNRWWKYLNGGRREE